MKLPSLMPKKLHYTAVADNDDVLYNMLVKIPPDLIDFFESACEDETWCEDHPAFTTSLIDWLTRRAFEEKIHYEAIQRCAAAIQKHYLALKPFIPKNITCVVEGQEYPVNSLLLAASSAVFYEAIRRECRERKSKSLVIDRMKFETFLDIQEFVQTGYVEELWRKKQEVIMQELREARPWELHGFVELCQEILKRYVDPQNVIETLSMANKENLEIIRKRCFEVLNQMDRGLIFQESDPGRIIVEFQHFRDSALDLFEKVRPLITHLVFTGNLTEEAQFSKIANRCPRLTGLNLSQTETFSDQLEFLPSDIEELDLSMCPWLNDQTLDKMIEFCPNIRKLRLASNPQIKYTGWSKLRNITRLESLDLTRCNQISNDEFLVIIEACRGLSEFIFEEISKVTDVAYSEIARTMQYLTHLNLSRTKIGDVPLIEIVTRCRSLRNINLTRCPNVTDDAVLQIVEVATALERINVSHCGLADATFLELKESHPFLEVIR